MILKYLVGVRKRRVTAVSIIRSVSYLVLVDAFGHSPSGHNIVHYPFGKRLWHLVQFHKLPNTIENVVIFGGGRCHLLDDSRHMSKNSGIEQR